MPTQRIFSGFGMSGRNFRPASFWSGAAPLRQALHLVDGAARDRVAQRGVAAAELVVHGDDAVADDDAEARLAVGDIACEFHADAFAYFLWSCLWSCTCTGPPSGRESMWPQPALLAQYSQARQVSFEYGL